MYKDGRKYNIHEGSGSEREKVTEGGPRGERRRGGGRK